MNATNFSEILQAIRTLIQETPVILSSPEDALYFRSSVKPTQPLPVQKAQLKKLENFSTTRSEASLEAKENTEKKTSSVFSVSSSEVSERVVNKKEEPPLPPPPPIQTKPPEPSPVKSLAPVPFEKPGPHRDGLASPLASLLQKLAPHMAILRDIPNDAMAKKIANRWKTKNQITPISILSFHEPQKQKALLLEISKAIDIYFGPARLIEAEAIEKEKQWDTFLSDPNLKCIVVCDYTLWQLGNLMSFYKENALEPLRTLRNVPLFLLPDLSLYLKDPLLKRSLWKGLCQKLSS